MPDLPTDWSALCTLVFLLGMRHGLDADHLAAIDGMTRWHSRAGQARARWCGTLFSLGHGSVVMGIALAVGLARQRWTPPLWLDTMGAAISIVCLLWLGIANLRAVWRTPAGEVVSLVGIKSHLLDHAPSFLGRRLRAARGPWGVTIVGGLFALSFDTLSQSALFAATATQFGGVTQALTVGGLFVGGMVLTDGLNGWWIARLIARADRLAAVASRVMSVSVASVSLLVAAIGLARLLSPTVAAWSDGREWLVAAMVMGILSTSYVGLRWRHVHHPTWTGLAR